MPDSIWLLLVCVTTLSLALLAAYLHSRRLGWNPADEDDRGE